MSDWGHGYVTDAVYTAGYYPQQSPRLHSIACLIGGAEGLGAAVDGRLSLLELGCGQGFTAAVQAASNPNWQVTAIDYNPAHIAGARALAAEAGLENIRFLEADLSDDIAGLVPDADVITLHGLWTWVPDTVRDGIVRLARARLRPGGVLHLSYNALPGWAGAVGLQRLIYAAGRAAGGNSERQAVHGLKTAEALLAADAAGLKLHPYSSALIQKAPKLPLSYLAHEYMNDFWAPAFHADVVRDLRRAKLDWIGSAALRENFPELTMTPEQRQVADGFDDRLVRELVKDLCLTRAFRSDVFVRGPRRIDASEQLAKLRDITLAAVESPETFSYEIEVPAGTASLDRAVYEPILAALAQGPRRIGDLLDLPGLPRKGDNPAELAAMLISANLAIPASATPQPSDAATRFNHTIAARLRGADAVTAPSALANATIGNGMPSQGAHVLAWQRLQAGETEPSTWAEDYDSSLSSEQRDELGVIFRKIVRSHRSIWQNTGVL